MLQLIGQLGLVLFMFAVGWDLDLQLVRRRERAAATVSIASILLPFALGLALAAHLHPEHDTVAGAAVPFWPFALFVGASLSLTAFPVLARILQRDRAWRRPRSGALVLTAAAVDDVIGWTVLAVALAVLASSGAVGLRAHRWSRSRCSSPWSSSWCGPLLHRLLRNASPAREALVRARWRSPARM